MQQKKHVKRCKQDSLKAQYVVKRYSNMSNDYDQVMKISLWNISYRPVIMYKCTE